MEKGAIESGEELLSKRGWEKGKHTYGWVLVLLIKSSLNI
jgi:hypothetical protein